MDRLVTTDWLEAGLGAPDLAIVDSTIFMPADARDARAEFESSHIPGARFLDIEALVDRSHPAPHMLPRADDFGAAMEGLGVGSDDRIVVYDNSPLRSAARGWFMLRHFGAERVAILDGGLGNWVAEGRPLDSGPPRPRAAKFTVRDARDVVGKQAILDGSGLPIVDARSVGRFEGRDADPRPGVASGHVPGARNLPFAALYRDDGTMKSDDELRRLFDEAGVDPARPFIASCGSGVTANSLIFAAGKLGGSGFKLYDGSWSEWGADPATPKQLGPAPPL